MLQLDRSVRMPARYAVSVAATACEIEEAQRLRWEVFVDEQGARPTCATHGMEADRFDAHCVHVIVRDLDLGIAVGTYRVLTAAAARALGGFYTEQEFDLGGLADERDFIVEIGRSCVHPEYRAGTVIALLWTGLADVILRTSARYVIGCASISLRDGGDEAASIYAMLARGNLAPAELRMRPLNPLQLGGRAIDAGARPPPLVKGYLRAGAKVAGPPAVDPAFGTADLPMLLTIDCLTPRYARHFTGG